MKRNDKSEKRGYYEANKVMDLFGLPVTVMAGNVIYNGLHWHDHVEILYCLKGTLHLRVEGECHHLLPGDFYTINRGRSHEIVDGREGNLQIICSVDPKVLGDMKGKQIRCFYLHDHWREKESEDSLFKGEICLPREERNRIREALRQMVKLTMFDVHRADQAIDQTAAADRKYAMNGTAVGGIEGYLKSALECHPLQQEENWCRYHMYMYQFLTILVTRKEADEVREDQKWEDINLCIFYIHEHLAQELNARILGEQLHVSESTIYRIFARKMGMHLNEYIMNVRLDAACRYLVETPHKIIEIAYACGFTGLSNFYRVFQLHLGMTPKEYRNSHRMAGGSVNLNEPNIMRLNRFQSIYELGDLLEEVLQEPIPAQEMLQAEC